MDIYKYMGGWCFVGAFAVMDSKSTKLSGHDNAILNKMFNPNMPFNDSTPDDCGTSQHDRKCRKLYNLRCIFLHLYAIVA